MAVGDFVHVDHAGTNRFHWGGKAGGRKLKPGSYRLRAVPVANLARELERASRTHRHGLGEPPAAEG